MRSAAQTPWPTRRGLALSTFDITARNNATGTLSIADMSDEELAEFIRTNAADVLEGLDKRKAPPLRERH